MKKTALSLSLSLAVLAGCMTGCSDVKNKKVNGKEVLFTVGDQNVFANDVLGFEGGNEVSYDFLKTEDGVKAVYGAIYSAIAQKNVNITTTIKGAVEEKMNDWNDEVKSYASTNGVTTRNAEKTKLETLGFKDVKELEQSYYVEEQKAELKSIYETSKMEPEIASANGSTMLERYVSGASPMIVKHVLVNIGDSNTIYQLAKITDKEVDKTTSVMQRLALGKTARNSFKNIAVEESDDGSASKGGNLGIMDTYTPFVSEFKLGLYVNEVVQNKAVANFDANDTLGTQGFKEDLFGTEGIYPNYEVTKVNIASLGAVLNYVQDEQAVEEQKAAGHEKSSEYDADLYPRNVIYNKYLNTPKIQYLTVDMSNIDVEIENLLKEVFPHATTTVIATKVQEVKDSPFFVALTQTANLSVNADNVVVDEANKPIVLAKSTYGFHFLSTTWSALSQATALDATKYFMYNTKLDGVTTYVKDTKYNFGYSTTTVGQNARKSEIKDRVVNFIKGGFSGAVAASDELYEFEIFNSYLANGLVKINSTELKVAVEEYIENAKNIKAAAISESAYDTWDSYVKAIEAVDEMHSLLY